MMPVYRRMNALSTASSDKNDNTTEDSQSQKFKKQKSHTEPDDSRVGNVKNLSFRALVLAQAVLLVLVAVRSQRRSKGFMVVLLATVWLASLPVFLILSVGLGIFDTALKDLPHQRYIPLALVATIVGNQLPTVLGSGMAAAGMLVFGLSSRPIESETIRNKESLSLAKNAGLSAPMKTVFAVMLMTTVLLTENFFIWVVSATYKASQQISNLPSPLQDNGQIVLRQFLNEILDLTKRDVVTLRNMINVEWILVSGLGMSLVAIEMQGAAMKRNMWSLAQRGLFTMTIARAIRTISFLITVLPSQNPRCYFSHFPVPPPKDWSTWLMTGFIPQANGGCNDLIISGHATVTSTLACVVTSIVGKPLFTTALWSLVAVDYMVEIYEGFHYSVDMWLGAIIVNFIWTVLAPIEDDTATRGNQLMAPKKFYAIGDATRSDWIKFSLPVVAAYVQVTGALVPKEKANYTIVMFIIAVIYQISTSGFQQYTQHCLFSLLYLALGIYL